MMQKQGLAYVLKRQSWRENDLRLSFLSQNQGVIDAIAFGALSRKSQRGKLCQPFNLLMLNLQVKVNDLRGRNSHSYCLLETQVVERSPFPEQIDSLFLGSGYYINECLQQLHAYLEIGVKPIELLQKYYRLIASSCDKNKVAQSLRCFELELFSLIGYDVIGLIKILDLAKVSHAYFDSEQGWLVSDRAMKYTLNVEQLSHLTSLTSLASFEHHSLAQLKRHNQRLLQQLSGGYEFQSRQWMKQQSRLSNQLKLEC